MAGRWLIQYINKELFRQNVERIFLIFHNFQVLKIEVLNLGKTGLTA
jgi:hypothetical protein